MCLVRKRDCTVRTTAATQDNTDNAKASVELIFSLLSPVVSTGVLSLVDTKGNIIACDWAGRLCQRGSQTLVDASDISVSDNQLQIRLIG